MLSLKLRIIAAALLTATIGASRPMNFPTWFEQGADNLSSRFDNVLHMNSEIPSPSSNGGGKPPLLASLRNSFKRQSSFKLQNSFKRQNSLDFKPKYDPEDDELFEDVTNIVAAKLHFRLTPDQQASSRKLLIAERNLVAALNKESLDKDEISGLAFQVSRMNQQRMLTVARADKIVKAASQNPLAFKVAQEAKAVDYFAKEVTGSNERFRMSRGETVMPHVDAGHKLGKEAFDYLRALRKAHKINPVNGKLINERVEVLQDTFEQYNEALKALKSRRPESVTYKELPSLPLADLAAYKV